MKSEWQRVLVSRQAVRIVANGTASQLQQRPPVGGMLEDDLDQPRQWKWRFVCPNPVRHRGRYSSVPLMNYENLDRHETWPGLSVPIEWASAKNKNFLVAPDLKEPYPDRKDRIWQGMSACFARVRRVDFWDRKTREGIIIGQVRRVEGEPVSGDSDYPGYLGGSLRSIGLLEIAMPPTKNAPANIILAHAKDVKVTTNECV